MAKLATTTDVVVDSAAPELLRRKLDRYPIASTRAEGFGRILTLSGVPDLGTALFSKKLSIQKLLELRHSKDAVRFRQWLAKADPKDGTELEKLFVSSISHAGIGSSWPVKVLRFALTNAWAGLELVSGFLAGAVDSFFVDSWLKGYSPKLYLDRAANLIEKA
jgi:hypothetical protein